MNAPILRDRYELGPVLASGRDGECQEESELYHDGDVIPFPGASVRLALSYP